MSLAFAFLCATLCNTGTAFQIQTSQVRASVPPKLNGCLLTPSYFKQEIYKPTCDACMLMARKDDVDGDQRWTPLSLQDKILLPLQIIAGAYILLVLPADIALGQPLAGLEAMGTLPYEYVVFFSLLLLPRAYQYGSFDVPDPNETRTFDNTAAPVAFAASLVGAHWIGAYQHAATDAAFFVPVIFLAIRLVATALVAVSGLESLGNPTTGLPNRMS